MDFTVSRTVGIIRKHIKKIKELAKMSPGTDNAISNEKILDWTNSTLIIHFSNFICVMHNSEVKPP